MQNTSETYHTSYVHKDSLGPMHSEPIASFLGTEPVGDWDAVRVPGDRSIVPLPGEAAPFPEIPSTSATSTLFISLFPTLQLNVTRDCAWWMRVLPTSPTTTKVTQGFLFPKATTEMPNFQELLKPYLYRWDLAVQEDNDISVNQQAASQSPHHRPGPYHPLEFAVHRFDNMVLDAVLDGETEETPSFLPHWATGGTSLSAPQAAAAGGGASLGGLAGAASGIGLGAAPQPSFLEHPAGPLASTTALGARPFSTNVSTAVSGQRRGLASAGQSLFPGSKVTVTGANGFIALHLVDQLLSAGYQVTAAVRTDNPAKLAPLRKLQAGGKLEIISGCDLLTPGSFDAAVDGSEVCFHTASPFWMDARISDPWAQLVKPAEQGTLNVLDACAKSSSGVRRVVLTSSFASLMNVGGHTPWANDFVYDESHWNVSSAPNDAGAFPEPMNAHAYRWSKTVAERAAWAHPAIGGQFDLVTVLPPMVLGENKQEIASIDDLNQSSLILYNLLAGKMEHVMPGSVGFVDVADVARAHVLAAQVPAAAGQRYLCSAVTKTWLDVVGVLRTLFPAAPLPTACADGSTTQPCLMLKNDKIRSELGLDFVPLEQTLEAQCNALIRSGVLKL